MDCGLRLHVLQYFMWDDSQLDQAYYKSLEQLAEAGLTEGKLSEQVLTEEDISPCRNSKLFNLCIV